MKLETHNAVAANVGSLKAGPRRFWQRPNERMQLTWLIGAPSRPASVHRRACGRSGLGSPATQLMRAVSRLLRLRNRRDKSLTTRAVELAVQSWCVTEKEANEVPRSVRFTKTVVEAGVPLTILGYQPTVSPRQPIIGFEKDLGDGLRAVIRLYKMWSGKVFQVDISRYRVSGEPAAGEVGLNTSLSNIMYALGLGTDPLGDQFGQFPYSDEDNLALKVKSVVELIIKYAIPLLENHNVNTENILVSAGQYWSAAQNASATLGARPDSGSSALPKQTAG